MKENIQTNYFKISMALLISLLCLTMAPHVNGQETIAKKDYVESPINPLVRNISESQPNASLIYPEKIMTAFDWAQHKNITTVRENQSLSYSFEVIPGTTVEDFNVALLWKSKSTNLDIDFGHWSDETNFVSLRQSTSNTDHVESIYIPRLTTPGTYSIIVRSESTTSKAPSFGSIFNSMFKKRSTRFLITWAGESREIKALNLRAKLQGPYDNETGLMNDNLRTLDLIPSMEPYFLMAWGGDGETIDKTDPNGVLTVTGNDAIVDWIKVQLYEYTFEGYGYVDSRSALLQRDGDIVDINGGPVQFWNLPPGNDQYYVAIQHRNHTTIITEFPHPIGVNEPLLDFTLSSTILSEDSRNPSRNLQNGEWVIWSGDVIRNGTIDEDDSEAALEARGQTGYLFEDVNLDGVCDVEDSNIILANQGKWDWG